MKKLISVILAVAMLAMVSSVAFAESPEMHSYSFPDGTTVEYYLDEHLNPYNVVNGVKTLMLIPLEHLKVTDATLLAAIQQDLPKSPEIFENGVSTFAVPTSYYDLSKTTNTYSKSVTFSGEEIKSTPVFKFSTEHSRLNFTTSNIKPITSDGTINLIYTYYRPNEDKWESLMYTGVNCSSGQDIRHMPDMFEYGKFTFNQYDTITSLTYKVTTYRG